MVGIVIVSHSAKLAAGVRELAREMAGPDVKLELAGGLDEPEALGTDAVRVADAIGRADAGDGVVVLMDLGSAVLSAETALDLLTPEQREYVRLCEAPLVEGTVAAAVAARLGSSLADVTAEARGGLQGKEAHLGAGETAAPAAADTTTAPEHGLTRRLAVRNPLGLHARPAARFVQTAAAFDADVEVTNLTTGRGPASARSLNRLATLGIRQGHEILVSASGPQAAAKAPPPPPAAKHRESHVSDPVLLFRYSALTFNSHRIHYDLPYTRDIEGYPALVMNGGLTALLLVETARKHLPDRVAGYEAQTNAASDAAIGRS